MIAISVDGALEVRRSADLERIAAVMLGGPLFRLQSIAFSPGGDRCALGANDRVEIRSFPEFDLIARFTFDPVLGPGLVAFLTSESMAGAVDGGVEFFDASSGDSQAYGKFDVHPELPAEAYVRRADRFFALRCWDLCEFDEATGASRGRWPVRWGQAVEVAPERNAAFVAGTSHWIEAFSLDDPARRRLLKGHATSIEWLDVSSDGRWLLSVGTPSDDGPGEVRVWDVARALDDPDAYRIHGDEVASHHFPGCSGLSFSSRGDRLFAASANEICALDAPFETAPRSIVASTLRDGEAVATQFLSDGEAVGWFVAHENNEQIYPVEMFDLDAGAIKERRPFPVRFPRLATLNERRDLVLCGTHQGAYWVSFPELSVLHRRRLNGLNDEYARLTGVAFSRDGRACYTATRDGRLTRWTTTDAEPTHEYRPSTPTGDERVQPGSRAADASRWLYAIPQTTISRFALSRDGTRLVLLERGPSRTVGAKSGAKASDRIVVLDAASLDVVATIRTPEPGDRGALAISPDDRLVAFGYGERARAAGIAVYDLGSGKRIATLRGHTQPPIFLCFSPDGSWIASAGDEQDAELKLWKAPRPKRVRRR